MGIYREAMGAQLVFNKFYACNFLENTQKVSKK